MDLTKGELSNYLTDPALKTWWDSTAALPAGLDMAEFLAKMIFAAYKAAASANNELPVGQRIDAYPSPSSSTPAPNSEGDITSLSSFTVRVRVPLDLDTAVAPQI